MAWCTWTKPSLKSRTKPARRCHATKAAALAAARRARTAGKAAGVFKKAKKTASKRRKR